MSARAREMIARVEKLWMDAEIPRSARDSLIERAEQVMEARTSLFADDHHPAFLHPLRTAQLLLEADETDPRAHTAALVLDTEGPGPNSDRDDVTDLVTAGPDERLERLVLADPWLRNAWLAERLDQIRHLHLWAGPERTRAALERAEREEQPLAGRVGGRLERAWSDWLDKTRRYRIVERAETRPFGASGGS